MTGWNIKGIIYVMSCLFLFRKHVQKENIFEKKMLFLLLFRFNAVSTVFSFRMFYAGGGGGGSTYNQY